MYLINKSLRAWLQPVLLIYIYRRLAGLAPLDLFFLIFSFFSFFFFFSALADVTY